jgi:hypothetical protein
MRKDETRTYIGGPGGLRVPGGSVVLVPAGIHGSIAGITAISTAVGADIDGVNWPAEEEIGEAAESPGQQGSSSDAS